MRQMMNFELGFFHELEGPISSIAQLQRIRQRIVMRTLSQTQGPLLALNQGHERYGIDTQP